jgi:hypothetical protein
MIKSIPDGNPRDRSISEFLMMMEISYRLCSLDTIIKVSTFKKSSRHAEENGYLRKDIVVLD